MLWLDLATALVVAAVCSAVVVSIRGLDAYAAGGWPTAVLCFGLFALVVWSGGVWLTPLGPELFGGAAAWIPFLIVGFMGALFLAAIAPLHRPRTLHGASEQAQAKDVARTTLLVVAAVVALVAFLSLAIHYGASQPVLTWH